MKCKLCDKKLKNTNKSGYCYKCYTKSPRFKKYQRDYQRKVWYQNNKFKKKEYLKKNKKMIQKYQKEYHKKYINRIRVQKRKWARKQRWLKKQERI